MKETARIACMCVRVCVPSFHWCVWGRSRTAGCCASSWRAVSGASRGPQSLPAWRWASAQEGWLSLREQDDWFFFAHDDKAQQRRRVYFGAIAKRRKLTFYSIYSRETVLFPQIVVVVQFSLFVCICLFVCLQGVELEFFLHTNSVLMNNRLGPGSSEVSVL